VKVNYANPHYQNRNGNLAAAPEHDKTLIEVGIQNRVVLAAPTILIALLRAIALGCRQESVAQNAKEISEFGKQLYDRIGTFVRHFEAVAMRVPECMPVDLQEVLHARMRGVILFSADYPTPRDRPPERQKLVPRAFRRISTLTQLAPGWQPDRS
jgi:hypothetical protein